MADVLYVKRVPVLDIPGPGIGISFIPFQFEILLSNIFSFNALTTYSSCLTVFIKTECTCII